jgi:hypothetical protein
MPSKEVIEKNDWIDKEIIKLENILKERKTIDSAQMFIASFLVDLMDYRKKLKKTKPTEDKVEEIDDELLKYSIALKVFDIWFKNPKTANNVFIYRDYLLDKIKEARTV